MTNGMMPGAESGQPVVVAFPGHVDASAAARAWKELLAALGSGARTVIADMSATITCDPAAVDVLSRACQRAAVSQARLRLVACEPGVRRLLSAEGLDRLVPVYASLEAALAAGDPGRPAAGGLPAAAPALRRPAPPEAGTADGSSFPPAASEAVLQRLLETLDDGVALVDGDGTIVLASRSLAAMLGYPPGGLVGQPVEALIPVGLRDAHRRQRAAYTLSPTARPMADRARLVALRSDGSTLPVTITLTPVPTATGHLVLAVVREATPQRQRDGLASLLSIAAVQEADDSRELLDRVVHSLLHAGLCLEAAARLPADVARDRITQALQRLDDAVHDIRDHVFQYRRGGAV